TPRHGLHDGIKYACQGSGHRTSNHDGFSGMRREIFYPLGEAFLPGNRRESSFASFAFTPQRPLKPVGIIEALKRRLTAGAEFPFVHGMPGISLDFFGSPFHPAYDDSASRVTFPAGRSIPICYSRNDVVVRQQVGHKIMYFPLTTGESRTGSS